MSLDDVLRVMEARQGSQRGWDWVWKLCDLAVGTCRTLNSWMYAERSCQWNQTHSWSVCLSFYPGRQGNAASKLPHHIIFALARSRSCGEEPTMIDLSRHSWIWANRSWPLFREDLSITGRDPKDSKSNPWPVDIFRFFFNSLRCML